MRATVGEWPSEDLSVELFALEALLKLSSLLLELIRYMAPPPAIRECVELLLTELERPLGTILD